VPALIEWDTDVPALEVLLEEAREAERIAAEADPVAGSLASPAASSVPVDPAAPSPATDSLAALQQSFGAALLDAAALPKLASRLKGDAGRLGIYRGNMASAWRRALASAYPLLRRLLGDARFASLAHAYGRAHPAQDPDLNRFGAGLADCVADDEERPWLPDLARLEWAVHSAWYAPDAKEAPDDGPRAALAALSPQQFEASRAVLHPSLRLHASSWAMAAFWLAQQADGADVSGEPRRQPGHGLVLRARWQVAVREIGAAEHAALARLASGASFGAAFDAGFDVDEDAPIAMWLDGWLNKGVLTEIVREAGPSSA
jgi:hypothetical protein